VRARVRARRAIADRLTPERTRDATLFERLTVARLSWSGLVRLNGWLELVGKAATGTAVVIRPRALAGSLRGSPRGAARTALESFAVGTVRKTRMRAHAAELNEPWGFASMPGTTIERAGRL